MHNNKNKMKNKLVLYLCVINIKAGVNTKIYFHIKIVLHMLLLFYVFFFWRMQQYFLLLNVFFFFVLFLLSSVEGSWYMCYSLCISFWSVKVTVRVWSFPRFHRDRGSHPNLFFEKRADKRGAWAVTINTDYS